MRELDEYHVGARGAMDSATEWSASHVVDAAPTHVYKVGIYGWRKRCLYLFVLLLMVMVIINLALLIWIVKVMDFSPDGMGRLRIVDRGIRLEGEAQFIGPLYTAHIESRKDMPLRVESARNITLHTRNPAGKIVNRLSIGDREVEVMADTFVIRNQQGKVLFSANDQKVEVAAEGLRVSGFGGAVFEGSIQTPQIRAEPGHQLRLESPTRSLQMEASNGISLDSRAGDITAICLNDLTLQSKSGVIKLDSERIWMRNLPEAATQSRPHQNNDKVFQLCACENGRLFLADASGHCKADTNICK